jgi:ferrochelatase
MMIENLTQICSGSLLNKPSVTSVTNFTCKSDKVSRGDAFFSLNTAKGEIKQALENGAYAIIYDGVIQTDDSEIAWIKVDDIKKAMIRVMRFEAERKDIQAVFLSPLQFDILSSFKLQFNALLSPSNIEELFSQLFKLQAESYLFSSNAELLEQLSPRFDIVKESAEATILQSHSIFRTSFVCGENFFKDYEIPSLFVPEFSALIDFLDEKSLPFKAGALSGHFETIFINTALQPRPFGSTYQAVIIETDERLFEREAKWIEKYVSDKYLLILAPHNAKISLKCKRYTSAKSLQTINISSIRYILILGDKEQIIAALEEPKTEQASLF